MTALVRCAAFFGVSAVLLTACGGVALETKGDGGTGGSGAVGQSAGGASTGGVRSSGGKTATGGFEHSIFHPSAGGFTPGAGGSSIPPGGAPSVGGGIGAGGCCAAAATCGANEIQVPNSSACPTVNCHQVSVCCSTIWCAQLDCSATCKPDEM